MNEQAAKALAEHIRRSRLELGISRAALAREAGLTRRTIEHLEAGRPIADATWAKLVTTVEAALHWEPGSIDIVLAGGEPIASSDPLPSDQ